MAAVAPAWRPGTPRTVAWANARGTVTVEDADTAKVLRSYRSGGVEHLAWSADGRKLLIAGRRHGTIHDFATGARTRLALDGDLLAAAYGPRGLALAVAARRPDRDPPARHRPVHRRRPPRRPRMVAGRPLAAGG